MQELMIELGNIQTVLVIVVIFLLLVVLIFQILFRYKPDKTIELFSRIESLQNTQHRFEDVLRQELAQIRIDSATTTREGREELTRTFVSIGESISKRLTENSELQQNALYNFSNQLQASAHSFQDSTERFRVTLEQSLKSFEIEISNKLEKTREDSNYSALQLRNEVLSALTTFNDLVLKGIGEMAQLQKGQLETFSENISKLTLSNETKLETLREIVERKLNQIQEDNAKQIEQMRITVDEKLQGTLEKRLGDSFRLVSERLEQVHKGLGEMQSLASGVGDLKRVLTNVKARGGWGEVQLGAILEQMLTPDQFEKNVKTKDGSDEVVEYAIKLPGQDIDKMDVVWLPVDSKFPIEDYQRLVDAQERADLTSVTEASNSLRARAISCAKEISLKYLYPPNTTDFGIMFLPVEGLYAEVIRQPGLIEELQHSYRVVVTGPTTFAALLNSLQMGFRTLKIQKQSSEVWKILSAVKTEFDKFGSAIDAVKKKLQEASNKIEDVDTRTRAVRRRLRKVEELPSSEKASTILEISESFDEDKDA
ncbi:MAG TPA: DNA recombination protein RmuC [Thermodesulfobacteriota bacterium]|nr:DNA recombination protein RmuC [Thermodesulfobacteriota bacterium]